MIDFIFDNIAIVGFVLYALIIFVSKIFSQGNVDENERRPVATPHRNKPISHPQKYNAPKPQTYNFPKAEDTYFGGKKIEPIEDFDDEFFADEYDADTPRKLVEQMSANAHFFHEDNSCVPEESILQDDNNDVILAEETKDENQPTQNDFADILKDTNALRKAFVASEILGKPKSMQ